MTHQDWLKLVLPKLETLRGRALSAELRAQLGWLACFGDRALKSSGREVSVQDALFAYATLLNVQGWPELATPLETLRVLGLFGEGERAEQTLRVLLTNATSPEL